MTSFMAGQKRVDVYPGSSPDRPVIYLNTYANSGASVYKNLAVLGCPDCLYFSLGDRESSTDNPILNTVEHNTREIESICRAKGIPTTFVLNKGNHFQGCNKRTAAGIAWILQQDFL